MGPVDHGMVLPVDRQGHPVCVCEFVMFRLSTTVGPEDFGFCRVLFQDRPSPHQTFLCFPESQVRKRLVD